MKASSEHDYIIPATFSVMVLILFVFFSVQKKQEYKDIMFEPASAQASALMERSGALEVFRSPPSENQESLENTLGSGYEEILGPGFTFVFPDEDWENEEERSVVIQEVAPEKKESTSALFSRKQKSETLKNIKSLKSSSSQMISYKDVQKSIEQKITQEAKRNKAKQFVAMSFDGSKSVEAWDRTRIHARRLNSIGIPIKYTYFISGVYFLESFNKKYYRHPALVKTGNSNIGFGGSLVDINARRSQINAAVKEGHEIGSHAVGHFDGSKWLVSSWEREFNAFNDIVFRLEEKFVPLSISKEDIKGFRAPFLGHNRALYSTLAKNNYTYDTSGVSMSPKEWPKKNSMGVWEFPLPIIPIGSGRVLAMDYNLYYYHTKAKNTYRRGTSEWINAYNDVYMGYVNYFLNNYNGSRAPMHIGHHFSLWNDGVYWQALADFSETICGIESVDCGTYAELAYYLESR